MNTTDRISLVLFSLLLASIPCARGAQGRSSQDREAEDRYKKWLSEDVIYIISDEEKTVFKKLTTSEEKDQFIEQFWLRRDPDSRTPANEFREEHYRRIAYANERFTSGDPGWMTDRGKIYIIHGPPDAFEARPGGGAYIRPIEEGGGYTAVHPYEKWRYRYIEGIGPNVELEFVDSTDTGRYELAVFPWEKDALLHIGMGPTLAEQTGLATRADHPALTPAAGGGGAGGVNMFRRGQDTPFARYELFAKAQAPPAVKYRALKEQVQVDVKYNLLPFDIRIDYLKLNDAQVLVPITVQIRNEDLTFRAEGGAEVARMAVYGIVTSLTDRIAQEFEGDLVSAFRNEDSEAGRRKASVYQKILPLNRNMRYKLDLVLKDLNGGRTGIVSQAIIPPPFSTDKLCTSSLILSSSIRPLEKVPSNDEMFVLGDVKVLPKMDRRFTREMPLGLYLQLYNAALDPTSLAPSLTVNYRLFNNGKLLAVASEEKNESIQFFSGWRVVLVKQLSLAGLEPGDYQVQVEVVDRLSDQRAQVNGDFSVVAESLTASAAQSR